MPNTTAATDPFSYYEALSTFWAATCAARGTDLRGQSLLNLDVLSPVPHGFVAELESKLRPAGIEHGLAQAGPGKPMGIDVPHADASVLQDQACGQPVQEVLAAVADLGVDCPRSRLASRPLCGGKRPLVFAIKARRLDLFPGRERRQGRQAEIDSDLADPMFPAFRDLHLQIEIPAATSILREASATNFPFDRTAEPEPISAPKKERRTTCYADRAGCLERNPSQRVPAAPSRPLAACVSRIRELLADPLHGIRVQTKQLTTTGSEIYQIEAGRPALVVPASRFLDLSAVVPHTVYRPRLALQVTTGSRILNPVSVGQHHDNMVVYINAENKIDAKNLLGIFTLYCRLFYSARFDVNCDASRTRPLGVEHRSFEHGDLV